MTDLVKMIEKLQEEMQLLAKGFMTAYDALEAIKQKAITEDAAHVAVAEQQKPSLQKRPVEPTGKPEKTVPGKTISFAPDSKGASQGND